MYHKPVLLNECINGLAIKSDGNYVDATFGGGGHSSEILKRLNSRKLLGFDQDKDAINNKFDDERFIFVKSNFIFLKNFLMYYKLMPVDGILADLGISSYQIDEPSRGFSTRFDGKLDMRMNNNTDLDAGKVINEYSENDLKEIFKKYGEIKNAGKLAWVLAKKRKEKNIETTGDLKNAVQSCVINKKENKYFAQVFQAIRIEVNDELGALKTFLIESSKVLKPGGRLVIMSYHSLEDRLVKNFLKSGNFDGIIKKDFYGKPQVDFKLINKKPIVADENEILLNKRARSAKLRIAEKL